MGVAGAPAAQLLGRPGLGRRGRRRRLGRRRRVLLGVGLQLGLAGAAAPPGALAAAADALHDGLDDGGEPAVGHARHGEVEADGAARAARVPVEVARATDLGDPVPVAVPVRDLVPPRQRGAEARRLGRREHLDDEAQRHAVGAAPAAAHRPEVVLVDALVGNDDVARGRHQLNLVHLIGAQPVLGAQRAVAPVGEEAAHGDGAERARHHGQVALLCGAVDGGPLRARADAHGRPGDAHRAAARLEGPVHPVL